MPHFFIESKNVIDNFATISDSENYRHIAKALRTRVGERLLLIDENQFEFATKVTKALPPKVKEPKDKKAKKKGNKI